MITTKPASRWKAYKVLHIIYLFCNCYRRCSNISYFVQGTRDHRFESDLKNKILQQFSGQNAKISNIDILVDNLLKYLLSGCSSADRTRGLGPRGREFESLHSDQIVSILLSVRGNLFMRTIILYLRQCFCKHKFEVSEQYCEHTSDFRNRCGLKVYLYCSKCGYHKSFWKF